MDGFTYRGKHCEQMGCFHIPNEEAIGTRMEEYTVSATTVAGRDGGYYFGATVNEKTFSIDCYFEELSPRRYAEQLEWLRRDKAGELIFDERPYVSYYVHPTKTINPKIYISRSDIGNLYSGTFTISFTAYNPFGEMLVRSYDGTMDFSGALNDTGIIHEDMMPEAPKVTDKSFLIYNCGTEKTPVMIRLAGDVGDGLTITNLSNGTSCKVIGLTKTAIPVESYLEIDGVLGQVNTVIGADRELAFEFHDLGYILLEPCAPLIRELLATYTAGSKIVGNNIEQFEDALPGQYIFLDGEWKQIGRKLDNSRIELVAPMNKTGAEITSIATMNSIQLEGNVELTKLEFDYQPRTR